MKRSDLDLELSKIQDKYGVFFAFSNKQYEEGAKEGVQYVHYGYGMFCPKKTIDQFLNEFDLAIDNYRNNDLAENGKIKIIWRELSNYECQITMDISEAVTALKGYGITKEEVEREWKEYFNHCIDNDLF